MLEGGLCLYFFIFIAWEKCFRRREMRHELPDFISKAEDFTTGDVCSCSSVCRTVSMYFVPWADGTMYEY